MDRDELISEDEAKALLEASQEDVPPPPGSVQDFDFGASGRILRGSLPALELIHERLCANLTGDLTQRLHRPVSVTSEPARAVTFSDYANELSQPASLNVIDIAPRGATAMVALESDVVSAVVDVFFGGKGTPAPRSSRSRFTASEERLARTVVEAIITAMQRAWEPVEAIQASIKKTETNPHFVPVAMPSETVYVARFPLQFGGEPAPGAIHLVLPGELIEPFRDMAALASGRGEASEEWRTALEQDVRDAELELRTVFAEAEVSLGDLLRLAPGDVLPVEPAGQVVMFSGETPVFRGHFGVSRGKNAVKVTSSFRREH